MTPTETLRDQYERFPYPPVPFLALPQKDQGKELRYELGVQLSRNALLTRLNGIPFGTQSQRDLVSTGLHRGIRILVAGAGTLEPLVVAQMHPWASEIVAADLSEKSLKTLEKRIAFARMARFPRFLPKIRTQVCDLTTEASLLGDFDYVIATHVLHHVENPARLLAALARQLRPGGILRLATYPKTSRLWMREVSNWFRLNGISASDSGLKKRVRESIRRLPADNPIRACFESHLENQTDGGIVDAFFNAYENPLSPLEWKAASSAASLRWIGETQPKTSQSIFLNEVSLSLAGLNPWLKLQILDDLLELCANPVLWFQRVPDGKNCAAPMPGRLRQELSEDDAVAISSLEPSALAIPEGGKLLVPSRIFWELKQGLKRVERLIAGTEVSLEELFQNLRDRVGPRCDPRNPGRDLPGMSLCDYELREILSAEPPWSEARWAELQAFYGPNARLHCSDDPAFLGGGTLLEQAEILQARIGARKNRFEVEISRQ